MGIAEDWQTRVCKALVGVDLTILNPRRNDWDANWEQSIDNTEFRRQVEWELAALEMATLVVMYFEPLTRSPITLLELGLYARSGKLVVCCPAGFWRKGNVDVVCHRYAVPLVPDVDRLVSEIRDRCGRWV